MKKNFSKITAFLLAFVILFTSAVYVLDFKYLDSIYKVDSFYELEDNTVDVLVLGSSHAYQGINTAVLWREYGISAFNFCGAAQPIWNTYYYLEEALKTQTPKAIILDTYYVYMSDDYTDASTAVKNTYGLKWSETKKEAIKASFNQEKVGKQYFFEILQYHSRYSDLSKTDFSPYQANKDMYENHKGFYCYFKSAEVPEENYSYVKSYRQLSEKVEMYYRKIFELANSKGIPVIATAIPFKSDSKLQESYNEARYIAEKEYGAEFYNFMAEYKNELGLDYKKDFADSQHLNHMGNTKLSQFFGKILREDYGVPDRRGDEKYQSWEADAEVYYNQLENYAVSKINKFEEYADVFRNERYTVVMTSSFNTIEDINDGALGRMVYFCKLLGIPEGEYAAGGMWVFEGGEQVYYNSCNAENFRKVVNFKGYGAIEINKTEMIFDEETQDTFFSYRIMDKQKSVTKFDHGLNIFVFDNFTQTKVDLIALNYNNNAISR